MSVSKHSRLAFVDIETTGGTAASDRITEIGIIEVNENGVREWSSLINPQMPIPPFIQSLTGISDAMVEQAPTFAELATHIQHRLADRIFIAHNARFDHGFLKSEFKRTGHEFQPPVLCTVRLSRKLFPGFARHNLDSLIERHQLRVTERHRALGDAQLIWQFWKVIHQSHPAEVVDAAVAKLTSRPSLPSRLGDLQIHTLPATHGVYLFYGENAVPLYIGRADNLRGRVLSHFSHGHASANEIKISQHTERIEWIETAGEIGASLLEAALVKKLKPSYNCLLDSHPEVYAWRLLSKDGMLQPIIATSDDLFFAHEPQLYGLFISKQKAIEALKAMANEHGLCHALLGLKKIRNGKCCVAIQLHQRRCACTGKESIESHNQRVGAALREWQVQPWPYGGAIGIPENGVVHVINGWAYIGTAPSLDQTPALLSAGQQRFDRNVYQIMQKWLPGLADRIIQF